MGTPPVRTLDDIVALGKEVVARGYTALKTNVLLLDDDPRGPRGHVPGFARGDSFPELNPERYASRGHPRPARRRSARAPGRAWTSWSTSTSTTRPRATCTWRGRWSRSTCFWVEIDTRDPKALHYIRSRTTIPVASCECLFGRKDYRPYFEHQSMDVAIIDAPWNGVAESHKIASMADTYEVNVAPTTSTATWRR